ncbi:Sodium/sulfate symporter [Candidatus Magnetomorum sp. HK-1]|nr:Sodium/sulfate symporter [Candidatus Magnetomorum sp. HK-1]
MVSVTDEIKQFLLFQKLTNVQRARLYPYLSEKKNVVDKAIANQGDPADKIILVLKGTPQLFHINEKNEEKSISNLAPFEIYGLSETIEKKPYTLSLYANKYTEYYEFTEAGVQKLIDYEPSSLRIELHNQQKLIGNLCSSFEELNELSQVEQQWRRLNKNEQLFVRLTCLMDVISENECTLTLGKKGCEPLIKKIAKYPQILTSSSYERDEYRYTSNLKKFLFEKKIIDKKQKNTQHKRIAKRALKNKNWELALEHFLEAEQYNTVILCLNKYLKSDTYDEDKYNQYVNKLPSEFTSMIPVFHQAAEEEKSPHKSFKEIVKFVKDQIQDNIGWMLCLILPMLSYYLASMNNFSWDQTIFLCILSSSVVMWMFKLVGDYIVSIYILIACLTLKIVPAKIVLGGFTSGSFFLAMSVFGLGAVLLNSGLIYRISLMILYYFPSTLFWQNLALSIVGTLITPVIPSANGRLALVSPTVMDMTETMGYKPLSNAGARLSMSTLSGFGLMSNFFLTGKSINFVILGLLPMGLQTRFTFGFWLMAAGVAFIISFVGRFALASAMFKAEAPPKISKKQIKMQINILGKLTIPEWIALIACFVFLIGVMTASLHKIKTAWVGVLILFIVLFIGELGKDDFKRKIDWPFLLFLGGLIGFVNAFKYLKLDQWMSTQLYFLPFFMSQNFLFFIIILSGIILFIRLILPANATVALMCAILMPVAQANGINPWIVGFSVLVISGGWFFPYQSTFYITFYNSTGGKLFSDKQTSSYNMLGNVINILSLILSIPYWKMLGLLK